MNISSDLTSSLGELTHQWFGSWSLYWKTKFFIYFGDHFLIYFLIHVPLHLLWHLFQGSQRATEWTSPPDETSCWILQCIEKGGGMRDWQRRSPRAECWERSSRECDQWLNWELSLSSWRMLTLSCPWHVHSAHCSHSRSLFQGPWESSALLRPFCMVFQTEPS